MSPTRLVVFSTLFAVLFGCGKEPAESTGGLSGAGKTSGNQPTNIKLVWKIASKKCDGDSVESRPLESYRLDSSHLIRIERLSEDQRTLCKTGHVYDRIVSSSRNAGSGYAESGILRSSASKKSCWTKKDGALVEPPILNEVGEFGPEQIQYRLSATQERASFRMKNSPECGGELALELVRAQ